MQISLTELRRTPAAALDHVRAGEEVVVTEAGVPLCRMVPAGRKTRYAELIEAQVLQAPVEPRDARDLRDLSLSRWADPA